MPEGDALYRYARRLRPVLTGKTIRAARAHGPGRVPDVARIVGATCTSVESTGKNLLIDFDNGLSIRGHLRMYGDWHVYEPGQRWRRGESHARLVLEVDGATVVNFDAPVVELLETRALQHHRPIASLGPDLLAGDFDPLVALRNLRAPTLQDETIGDALMVQQALAGIGNIWKHETLFRCRTNPWLIVRELNDDDLAALIETARTLLRASVGLESLGPSPGKRPTYYAYGRARQPCRRCNTILRRDRQGADIRYTAWCPKCQPLREGQALTPNGRAAPMRT